MAVALEVIALKLTQMEANRVIFIKDSVQGSGTAGIPLPTNWPTASMPNTFKCPRCGGSIMENTLHVC